MIVTLIPMFLAASIGVKEKDWKWGPEAIYDVSIDSVTHPFGVTEEISNLNVTIELNCRPMPRLSLVCKLTEPNVARSGGENVDRIQDEEEIRIDDYFALKFGDEGIGGIVVPPSINNWKLEMLKMLVAKMSVDAKFLMDETKNLTNPITRNCGIDYAFSSADSSDDQTTKPYQMMIVRSMKMLKGEKKEFKKIASIDNCYYRASYLFGSRELQRARNMRTKLTSSNSYTIIREREWISWYENSVVVRNESNSTGFTVTQRVTLSLKNIVPATGPLPTIPRPSTVELFPSLWLPGDIFEKKHNSEETNNLG